MPTYWSRFRVTFKDRQSIVLWSCSDIHAQFEAARHRNVEYYDVLWVEDIGR